MFLIREVVFASLVMTTIQRVTKLGVSFFFKKIFNRSIAGFLNIF